MQLPCTEAGSRLKIPMMPKPLILVVDDDPPILMLMRSLLREFGFEPVTSTGGAEAVAAARDCRPSLVLLDKNMPGMDAPDIVRAIRSETGLGRVPVLIVSGEPVEPAELESIGADGAVQKPFDISALIEQIRIFVEDGNGSGAG